MIGVHQEISNEHILKVSSKSDNAVMINLQIRTPKLVHYQAEFLLLVNLRTVGVVQIFVQISYVYTAMQRKPAIGTQKTSNRYSDL